MCAVRLSVADRYTWLMKSTLCIVGVCSCIGASTFAQAPQTPNGPPSSSAPSSSAPSTSASSTTAVPTEADLRKSVVQISVKQELRSPLTPWKRETPQGIGGSGVVIAPGRILTNAHVALEASEILIESSQTSLPIQVELLAIDPTRDLALLEVTDADFIKNHPPVALLDGLPKEGARVTVMGYPLGGDALSTTSGVISRTEWADIGNHAESGMRVQVDAAVNHGNSGGPAFVDGVIAGLAFSGLSSAEADNISYLIATEEIKRFLDEVKAGRIDGDSVWNVMLQTLENPALRAKLGVTSDVSGVVVVDQRGGPLAPWDIITSVNGSAVDNKGQITIEGDRKVEVDCAVGRFVATPTKPTFTVEVIRAGKPMSFELPALLRCDRVISDWADGNYPYLMYGPLVFSPLTQSLLGEVGGWMVFAQSPITPFVGSDLPSGGKQFVAVASGLLSSPIARGYEVSPGQTVKSVNGKTFTNFREFVQVLRELKDEFVTFEFNESGPERIVMRRSEIESATEKLMDSNGIRRQCSKDVADIWEKQ